MNETAPPYPPGPRARFPGQLILALRGDRLSFFARVAREFGDIAHFRVGRLNYYLLSHPDFVRDVLVTHDASFTKGPALRAAKATLGEGLLTSEGDFHRRQRRLAQPAFHPNRVSSYANIMAEYAREECAAWSDDRTTNIHEEMMRTTLRIVAKTLFDADVRAEVDQIGRAMDISVKMFTRAMSPLGPLLNRLPLPSNVRFRRAYARLLTTIDRFIAERRSTGVDHGDLLSMLLRTHDESGWTPGENMASSDKQLRDECMTLFTAGHETTANALTFTWHLLAHHPEIQKRLHAEIDEAIGDRLPGQADVERLPFTRKVVAESMRLYPPAWAIGRQAKTPVEIGGYTIPEDTVVLFCPWIVHRDARWWPEPEKFDPDRWTDAAASARPRWAYFPFGGGSRSCIGESFAWMEAILVIATIARQWRMEPAGPRHPPLRPTITLRPEGRLMVRLHRRA